MVQRERPRSLGIPSEVAAYLSVPTRTLSQWRYLGKGPRFVRIGKHVRYRWADVERWLDQHATGGDVA